MQDNVNEVTKEITNFAPVKARVIVYLIVSVMIAAVLAYFMTTAYNYNLRKTGDADIYARLSPRAMSATFFGLVLFTSIVGGLLLALLRAGRRSSVVDNDAMDIDYE